MLSLDIFFFSSKRKEKKTKKKKHRKENKCREGRELAFKLPLYPFTFGFCFYPPTSALLFQTLSLDIFFSSRRKEKKNIEKKRNAEKGGSLPLSSHSTLSLLAFASTLPLLPFCFKHFLLASSSSQIEEKRKRQRKKKHREKKNAK